MKCKCKSCSSILYIDNTDLRKLKRPRFICPQCQAKILILPKKAQCGKCLNQFGYFTFMLKKGANEFTCPNCNAKNRIIKR